MRNKLIKILLINLLILFSFSCFQNISFANDFQTVNVNRNYKHPVTSEILDPGKNFEIGQGMVEGVVLKEGKIENADGQLYALIHFSMMDYLKNIRFSIQEPSESTFKDINYEILENNGSSAEFKVPLYSENSILKVNAYVEPMEREVIFFINFDGYKPLDAASAYNNPVTNADLSENTEVINNQQKISIKKENNTNDIKKDFEHGLLLKDSEELKIYLNEDKEETKEEIEKIKLGPVTEMFILSFLIFLSVFCAILFAYSLKIRLKAKRLEKINRNLEEILYEED